MKLVNQLAIISLVSSKSLVAPVVHCVLVPLGEPVHIHDALYPFISK